MYIKHGYCLTILVSILMLIISVPTFAKSIYAITNYCDCEISVYKVIEDSLEYQMDGEYPSDQSGAVGLALDPCSNTLFVSYDSVSKYFSIINAKTMELIETRQMDYEFGALAYDNSKQKLYGLIKDTKTIKIYSWDKQENILIDDNDDKYLEEVAGVFPYYCAFGIALDTNDGFIYVSDASNKIYVYNTYKDTSDPNTNWSYEGYFEIKTEGNEREAVGIDVFNNGQGTRYLYSGCWPHDEGHKHFTRTNINDPNDCIEVLVGDDPETAKDVAGVAVDDDTGLVYVTTFHQDIRVYDPNLVLLHVEETPGDNPADIVLAGDVTYKPPTLFLDKSDNVDPNGCISPSDIIFYTFVYGPGGQEQQNLWLTDFLPPEVELVWADPNYTDYDPQTHIVRWHLDDLDPNDPNACVYLWVAVNESAQPTGTIFNACEIESDSSYNTAEEITPVCCWSEILYVDQSADGFNNGMSWQNAFTELYDALDMARNGCGMEIWVAEGTYVPKLVSDPVQYWYYEPFAMVDGVPVYGGFPSGGGDWQDRDWLKNETILGGNGQSTYKLSQVVTFDSCNENTILDGFTVTDSYSPYDDAYGIYIEDSSPIVTHNRVTGHEDYGVYVNGGSPLLIRNRVEQNDAFGIYIDSGTAAVTHNYIGHNGNGLYANNSAPYAIDNMIYQNDLTGVYLNNCSGDTILRNNTIADNLGDGIVKWGGSADPNIVVENCIVWKNADGQVLYCPVRYSCVYDPLNDPNGVGSGVDEDGNITADPQFAYPDDDDYHLDANSPCIDAGEPEGWYEGEKDIDGHKRLLNGGIALRVDMGADEVCNGSDTNYADFNDDGYVDMLDYALLAAAWLSEPPSMNPLYDLNADEIVSLIDLSLLTDQWLWEACWQQPEVIMMGRTGGGLDAMSLSASQVTAVKQRPESKPLTAKEFWELVYWLEELRQTNEHVKEIPEDEWQDFMKRVYLTFEYLE